MVEAFRLKCASYLTWHRHGREKSCQHEKLPAGKTIGHLPICRRVAPASSAILERTYYYPVSIMPVLSEVSLPFIADAATTSRFYEYSSWNWSNIKRELSPLLDDTSFSSVTYRYIIQNRNSNLCFVNGFWSGLGVGYIAS